MSIDIKGFQKTDLVNFDPYSCATIYLSRCNFLCPFCHNPELVIGHDKLNSLSKEKILDVLTKRKKWYDAVCITGGEPTLHKGLVHFTKELKKIGFLVKIDTNGTNPKMINQLIDKKIVDFISMDVKAPLEKYDKITQINTDTSKIKESIETLKNRRLDYEFRTTVIPRFHKKADIEKIGKLLKGSKQITIQQFRNSRDMINPSFKNEKPYSREKLIEFREILSDYAKEVRIR
ncbi:anaerobic ribonucleoside-triphosphate reductase activating protein [Candidatus Woesearchaeota archaeon]|nr:anaerobic ribonucleoside-triphosphate reductase activating protein [Candidatus Woesearchaeota archaeon]